MTAKAEPSFWVDYIGQMHIVSVSSPDDANWLGLRMALWPETSRVAHHEEMAALVGMPGKFAQFLAVACAGDAIGLAEVSIRADYVNGTNSSPVAFLEGIYVVPERRKTGAARALLAEIKTWAREQGCIELASDTPLDNTLSQAVHSRLGFMETERVVYFNMPLC